MLEEQKVQWKQVVLVALKHLSVLEAARTCRLVAVKAGEYDPCLN